MFPMDASWLSLDAAAFSTASWFRSVEVSVPVLWMEASFDQKQRLQQVFFPDGLRFDGEEFGTSVTCLAFKQLSSDQAEKSEMVGPPGFEPGTSRL